MSPKVSVNIACYNHEAFIGEAIQSVLNQTFQDFEIIICNNGSTDRSLEIIESFKDPRIKVESVYPNRQSTFAGANCVERGCGEYVALLCSDDAWEPDKLEKQVKYLDEHLECGAVFTRVIPFDENSKICNKFKNFYNLHFNTEANRSRQEWLRDILLRAEHSFCCSSACVRRECFDKYGNFDIRAKHVQDFIIWTGILLHKEVYILDDKLTKMRFFKNETNLGALSPNTIICSINEEQLLFDKFKEITNLDDFLKMFPEAKEDFSVLDEKYIPFYLCMYTFYKMREPNFLSSAVKWLYDFYADKDIQKGLEEDLGFDYLKLYELMADVDPYGNKRLLKPNYIEILKPAVKFYNKHIFHVKIYKDKIYFKIFGKLKTHIRFRPKPNNEYSLSQRIRYYGNKKALD